MPSRKGPRVSNLAPFVSRIEVVPSRIDAANVYPFTIPAIRKLEILPYLVRLRDEANIPMVYVSHDVAELRQLATQIVMLRQGRVTSFGGVKVLT